MALWNSIRNKTQNNRTWKALLIDYRTSETPKSLSGKYLDIVTFYFDNVYMSRIFKFYETPKGLLIVTNPSLFLKQKVLIPWELIQPTQLHNVSWATMQGLTVVNDDLVKIDITRMDFIHFIRNHLSNN